MMRALYAAILSVLLSGCEVESKYQITLKDTVNFGFEKSLITDLGRLILVDYAQFRGDQKNSNPAFPNTANFPEDSALLQRFSPIANLQGRDGTHKDPSEFYGHIWKANKLTNTLIISIRGTSDIHEWIDDAKFILSPFSQNILRGSVEDGFNDIFKSLAVSSPNKEESITLSDYLNNLKDVETLIVTGHSLGSSLATLVALSASDAGSIKKVKSLTFASPLTGDPTFVKAHQANIIDSIRIVNHPDLVPRAPLPEMGYAHVWYELEINSDDKPEIIKSIACYHSLSTYLNVLDDSIPLEASCKAPSEESDSAKKQ